MAIFHQFTHFELLWIRGSMPMTMRSLVVVLTVAALVSSLAAQKSDENPTHIDFSLVRGSIGKVSPKAGGVMTDAPATVLSFTNPNGNRTLVVSDERGDYTAALQPGHYCVHAYNITTGNQITLDARQLKCIDLVVRKDFRLDVMLSSTP
jgi:hypothetical protein